MRPTLLRCGLLEVNNNGKNTIIAAKIPWWTGEYQVHLLGTWILSPLFPGQTVNSKDLNLVWQKKVLIGNFQFSPIILYILRQFCKYTVDIAFWNGTPRMGIAFRIGYLTWQCWVSSNLSFLIRQQRLYIGFWAAGTSKAWITYRAPCTTAKYTHDNSIYELAVFSVILVASSFSLKPIAHFRITSITSVSKRG